VLIVFSASPLTSTERTRLQKEREAAGIKSPPPGRPPLGEKAVSGRERVAACRQRHREKILAEQGEDRRILVLCLGGTIGTGWCECRQGRCLLLGEILGRFTVFFAKLWHIYFLFVKVTDRAVVTKNLPVRGDLEIRGVIWVKSSAYCVGRGF
jgi:hypothetical protein